MALPLIVSPILQTLVTNLDSLIQKEFGLIWGVDEEMKKLALTLRTIQHVLQDAEEEKQLKDNTVASWLGRLKVLAYDADDILDDWATEAMEPPSEEHKQVCGSIFSCFCFKVLIYRRKIAKRVNELEKKFDEISAEKSRFQLREERLERRPEHCINQETSSRVSQQVYGRDEEKDYVLGQLLDGAKREEVLTVCPIVGIGGLGKTTVAQLCFNDERIQHHFEVKIWVCVSDDFDVKRLIKEVAVSISKEAREIEQLGPLQNHLEEKLANKRFLIVLDNVWSDDQEKWNSFTSSFRRGAIGSSIIVTTRLQTVASITKTCDPCILKPMSAKDCWHLFRQQAFGMGEEESPNLVKIGKQIVEKCGGLPLAARVLGSLMRFEREEKIWLSVKDNEIWNLPQTENNTILPALRLSYSHLTPELKQCFSYCSVFPKGTKMIKEDLIHLWMANNLIQPQDRRKPEDTGNQLFKELSLRNFFQGEETDPDGVVSCMMHDLLHDLAYSINKNECRHLDEIKAGTEVPRNVRHLSVSKWTNTESNIQTLNNSAAKLRTFLLLNDTWSTSDPGLWPHVNSACFSSLRALLFRSHTLKKVPDSVSKLKHLRYLSFSLFCTETLPESLCELRNLQTLKLEGCYELRELPKGMGKMRRLRHLIIDRYSKLSEMPMGMGKLICLQTLSIFIVGTEDGRRIKELQDLVDLSGELTIKELHHVKTAEEAREALLIRKENLLSLKLDWICSDDAEHENDRDVAEGLQPHSNLKKLRIEKYRGLTFPSWLDVSFVPNLVQIHISECKKCEHLPSLLGKLPLLESLHISGLTFVKFLFASKDEIAQAFLSLESLILLDMSELEDWFPSAGGSSEEVILFPRLSYMSIGNCPRVRTLPRTGPASLTMVSIDKCPDLSNVSFGLRYQTSLRSLMISGCPRADISKVEYQDLNSLRELKIIGHNDMTSLPNGLQHVSSTLRELQVMDCPVLISLPDWIETFTKLQRLTLEHCRNIKSLPDGLQHLTNLQYLVIANCHTELHGRCKKNEGEDWPKIAHILSFHNYKV